MRATVRSALLGLVLGLCGAPLRTHAQEERAPGRTIALDVAPLFTSDGMSGPGTVPLRVTLTNHTRRALRGDLVVTPHGWVEQGGALRTQVDLGPEESRALRVVMRVTPDTERFVLSYRPAGQAEVVQTVPAARLSGYAAVVLADPSRMRAHLLPIVSSAPAPTGYPGAPAVAEVTFDPESGDPLVPDEAAGWSSYPIVFASLTELERLTGVARRAFVEHVQAGARVVLVPHGPEDCTLPITRELMGEVRCTARATQPSQAAGPDGIWDAARQLTLEGDADTLAEPFGLSRQLGFGTVFLLAWDANSAQADPNATAHVLRAMLVHLSRVARPHHALGGVPEDGSALRTALDPNESFRPALGAVAILLLLYVFVVGPLNFHLVAQRGKPTLALVTTPLIALACLFLLAGAAYLSKGVFKRYRSVEVVELMSGEDRGVRTRYLGYYLTRPSTFDITPSDGTRVTLIERDFGGRGPVSVPAGVGNRLTEVRSGLWETVVSQEQAPFDGAGALRVSLRVDGTRVEALNQGTEVLRGAVYVSPTGEAYVLGDIAPGGRATTSGAAIAVLSEWELRMPRGDSPEVARVVRAMGLPSDAAIALRGALSVIRQGASREGLWAVLEGPGEGPSAEGFELDWEHRFVFVAANHLVRAPSTRPDPQQDDTMDPFGWWSDGQAEPAEATEPDAPDEPAAPAAPAEPAAPAAPNAPDAQEVAP